MSVILFWTGFLLAMTFNPLLIVGGIILMVFNKPL